MLSMGWCNQSLNIGRTQAKLLLWWRPCFWIVFLVDTNMMPPWLFWKHFLLKWVEESQDWVSAVFGEGRRGWSSRRGSLAQNIYKLSEWGGEPRTMGGYRHLTTHPTTCLTTCCVKKSSWPLGRIVETKRCWVGELPWVEAIWYPQLPE